MTQYVTAKVQTIEKPIIAWALVGIVATLVCVYIYFVSGAVVNAITVKDMQVEIAGLTSSIGGLESNYLAMKSAITLDSALAQGYTQPTEVAIYVAKQSSASLSFNR